VNGSFLTLKCIGINLQPNDLIWQYYPINHPESKTVVYFNSEINNYEGKYNVTISQQDNNTIVSYLTIAINYEDSFKTYECVCNIYSACSSGERITSEANVTVIGNDDNSDDTYSDTTPSDMDDEILNSIESLLKSTTTTNIDSLVYENDYMATEYNDTGLNVTSSSLKQTNQTYYESDTRIGKRFHAYYLKIKYTYFNKIKPNHLIMD
jgi:hypothetical protein